MKRSGKVGMLSPGAASLNSENFKVEKSSYFEIHRTPPEEKRRAEKALALAASQEVYVLLLTPFTTIPRISFDRIKLGTSSVRQLVVRNPGTKEITVSIERPPSSERGFALDYHNFRLGGREETTLHVGWTPVKGGGVRDHFNVKFGGFRTQVVLLGDCVAPEEKKQYRPPPPSRPIKPLGTRNTQKSGPKQAANSKAKPSGPPKITIPPNPVVLQNESPPKRMYSEEEGSAIQSENRRETFVRERPLPAANDVIQSTPKVDGSSMGPPSMIPPDRRQTYIPSELEQVLEDDKENVPAAAVPSTAMLRRQTFKAEEAKASVGMLSANTGPASGNPGIRRATYVKSPGQSSWTPQKPFFERRKWSPTRESFGNLSGLRKLNDSYASTVFGDVTTDVHPADVGNLTTEINQHVKEVAHEAEDVRAEDDNISIALEGYCLSPTKEIVTAKKDVEIVTESPKGTRTSFLQQQPLNLSVKKGLKTDKYQPDVSDISLAEYDLNLTDTDAVDSSLAVNVSGWKPGKRLDEFDDECLDDDKGDADIDQALDDEIERLATLRATSGCKNEMSSQSHEEIDLAKGQDLMLSGRMSTGTVIKQTPSNQPSALPDCTDISLNLPNLDDLAEDLPSEDKGQPLNLATQQFTEAKIEAIRIQEDVVCIEKEVIREEVVEEVIEYEYEINKDGTKTCVGERNLGKTVTTQETEKICRTPSKHTNVFEKVLYRGTAEESFCQEANKENPEQFQDEVENISKLIEENLQTMEPKDTVPRGAKLSDSELDGMLGMLALSQQQEEQQPQHVEAEEDVVDNLYLVPQLPGLRGSPKVSNQLSAGGEHLQSQHASFLHKTVTEASFLPPSPDDPRRCSTGIKDKNKEHIEPAEPSPHIKKSLFQQGPSTTDADFQEIPLSSGGHALPIIAEPDAGGQDCRLSSDTYVAAGEVPPLSTIQELEEMSHTKSLRREGNNTTVEKEGTTAASTIISAPTNTKSFEVESQDAKKDGTSSVESTKKRTPAKPSRVNAKYISKPIEQVAIDKPFNNKQLEEEDITSPLTSGLMFVALSPEKQEKRKSAEMASTTGSTAKEGMQVATATRKEAKKTRYSLATANPASSRSTVKRGGATLPRKSMTASRTGGSTMARPSSAAKPAPSAARTSSSAAGRRSIQPSNSLTNSRLNLTKKRHSMATVASTRPNPFASRNRYYDERWIEKQEKGFCNWLNFILTPQSLDTGNEELPRGSLDIGKLWAQCSQGVKVPRAPTREVMSMRAYTINREMNRLRRAACKLWQSRSVATVIERMELEIEKLRLVIRKDKQINKDVGMKQSILSLVLSYNPLWLRIALETVYGEVIMLHGNSDILGISRFLITRFLSCPDILQEYAHPTVPHSYRDGHQDALNKFTLKKFLEIVYLLDQAKEARIIRHNPCLFCPDSQIKSSRDMLVTFSKDYLSGEGDIIKHLAYLDYAVTHKQTPLDEFDYAVTSISADLRCGLRLTKVAELLTGADELSRQLRIPTVSRLQKVHNTEIALKQLKANNPTIPDSITGKDIVDGHREKTLSLLWSIIFGFQLNQILDEDKLRAEILHLRKSLRLRVRLGDKLAVKGAKFLEELKTRSPVASSGGGLLDSYNVGLLKEWAQLVSAHYHVEIENWTVSWCDGRGLCFLMHHYQPGLIDREAIAQETTITSMSCSAALDDSLEFSYGNQNLDKDEYNVLLENEKKNFKLLLSKVRELGGVPILINTGDMSNTIPDEKVTVTFIGYLAARLLDISREIQAARTIQLAWRKYYAAILEERMKVKYA